MLKLSTWQVQPCTTEDTRHWTVRVAPPSLPPHQPRGLDRKEGHGATGAWDQDCHASFQGGTEPLEPGTKTATQASRGARSHRSLGPRLPRKLPGGHGATGAWDQDYHASFQRGTEPPEPGTKTTMQASRGARSHRSLGPRLPCKLPGGHGATGAWDQDYHASFQGGTEPPEPGTKTTMQASRGARSHWSLGPRLPRKLPGGHGATGAWDQDCHASFQRGTEPLEPGTKTTMQASRDIF